jgi:hypothetical protein
VDLFVNIFFEKRLEQLFELAEKIEKAFSAAGLDYRLVGGLATYLYVEEAEPDSGRLTKDIYILVRRDDLQKIAEAVIPFGLQYRQVEGQICWYKLARPPRAERFIWCSLERRFGPSIRSPRQASDQPEPSATCASPPSPTWSA